MSNLYSNCEFIFLSCPSDDEGNKNMLELELLQKK